MIKRSIMLCWCWLFLIQAAPSVATGQKLESDLLGWMQSQAEPEAYQKLRERWRTLAREQVPSSVTLHPRQFQFAFSGTFPADSLIPDMLEYVVSSKDKAHETLLVVENEELRRIQEFSKALVAFRKTFPALSLNVQLIWCEQQRPRQIDLRSVLATAPAEEVNRFFRILSGSSAGLGADNLLASHRLLPQQPVPAIVLITVIPPQLNAK